MVLKRWGRLPDFEAVLRRFPFASAAMAALAILFMVQQNNFDDAVWKAALGLILGGYLCVGIQLMAERRGTRPLHSIAKGLALAASVGLSVYLEELAFLPWVGVIAAILFLGNFAFWKRGRDDAGVWLFTQKFWTGAIFAFVGSIIFAIGTFAIIGTLKALFGVSMEDLAAHFILPLGLAFLAPIYWMGTIPRVDGMERLEDAELSFEGRALAFLGIWLLAPLTLIYAVILLAYLVRVVTTMSLPEGEVALLVGPFIGVGTLTWLMLEPRVLGEGAFVRFYRRVWFPIAAVAAILLAVAVYERVSAYGWTPERFILAAVAAGAFVTGVWFTFTRRRDIRIPTGIAAAMALLCAFVAKPVSDLSQVARLDAAMAMGDVATAHQTVRETVKYLGRNHRADWVTERLGPLPDDGERRWYDWEEFARNQGYTLEVVDGSQSDFRSVYYAEARDVDVSATPLMRGAFSIAYYSEPGSGLCTMKQHVAVLPTRICLTMDGVQMSGPNTIDFQAIYLRDSLPSGQRTGQDRASPVFTFVTDDGLAVALVPTSLSISGEGENLTGANGQVMVFTPQPN